MQSDTMPDYSVHYMPVYYPVDSVNGLYVELLRLREKGQE